MDAVKVFHQPSDFNRTDAGYNLSAIDPHMFDDFSALETLDYWPHQVILVGLYTTIAILSFLFNNNQLTNHTYSLLPSLQLSLNAVHLFSTRCRAKLGAARDKSHIEFDSQQQANPIIRLVPAARDEWP